MATELPLNRFHEALQSLVMQPERCRHAPENSAVEAEVRQFLFGKRVGTYRVLFPISKFEVRILHIRRAAMGTATSEEINS